MADTDAGLRTFRVERVTSVAPTGEPVVRPDGFDLEAAWKLVTDAVDARWYPGVRARAAATTETVPVLRMVFGPRVRIGPTRPDSRVDVEIGGAHEDALAGELAGFGASVEVLEPVELRRRLARIASELSATYAAG